jgi:glycosyltransferase involved in cell wall biosynthesis
MFSICPPHRHLRRTRRSREKYRSLSQHALVGSKIVIGDGPQRARLQQQYPNATFTGYRFGDELASQLAASDVMVFPSRTDTFGLVNLEAMTCGVPVAAYPVTGPIDVIQDGVTGALDHDLAAAARRALGINPDACRARALQSGWDISSREFEDNLVPCRDLATGQFRVAWSTSAQRF